MSYLCGDADKEQKYSHFISALFPISFLPKYFKIAQDPGSECLSVRLWVNCVDPLDTPGPDQTQTDSFSVVFVFKLQRVNPNTTLTLLLDIVSVSVA